jgi:acetyltransferase-like isoleucine patch superfamily enzyme
MNGAEEPTPELVLPAGVTVGRHTYGHDAETFRIFIHGARIEVGSFCSVGPEVRILAGSEHVTSRASTFPLNALLFEATGDNSQDAIDKGTTIVGHDVWIGLGATILSGVIVGDGAVIGAGTVVSKAVPPYAVVVGNPAEIVRYRFDADIRRRLLAVSWWDWSDRQIRAFEPCFMSDVEAFLDKAERLPGAPPRRRLTHGLDGLTAHDVTPVRGKVDAVRAHDPSAAAPQLEARIGELESRVADMQSSRAWRFATRYWRLRASLRRLRGL